MAMHLSEVKTYKILNYIVFHVLQFRIKKSRKDH